MRRNQTTLASAAAFFLWLNLASRLPAQTAITASPAQLTFNVSAGAIPGTQNLFLSSNTGTAVKFTIAPFSGSNWLSVTPASGTTPAMVSVSVNPGSLTAGVYTGFISIVSGVTTTVPVTLNIDSGGFSTFTAQPASFTFSFATGDINPKNQTLSITGPGSEMFTATPSTTDGGSWLTVDPASGTTPGSLSVSVDPSSLGDGSYFGSIAISTPSGTGLVVPVQVNVALQGMLNVSPQELTFSFQVGNTTPAVRSLTLSTTSATTISFTASAASAQCGSNWLSVSPQSGLAPASVNVQINPTGLIAGTCTGTIDISAPSAAVPAISIPVTLVITTSGLLQIPTSGVSFTYQVGTLVPAAQTVQVTSSSSAVPFTVSATPVNGGPAFLDVSPVSGSTPQAITLMLDMPVTEGLAPNIYAEMVTLSSSGSESASVTFPVTLVVSNNPILLVSQSTVTFNYQIGQSGPQQQTLTLSSSGAPLGFTVTTSTANCPGFLLADTTSGMTATTDQPAEVTLSVDTTKLLTPQTCNGTVTLSVPGSSTPPQTIPVVVNVSSTPLLDAYPRVINVSAIAGIDMSVQQQTISLTSTDGTTAIDFTAVVTTPVGMTWLSVDRKSGSVPATLNVTINPGNLPVGTYMGSIDITSTTAGVLPQSIPVVLTVSSGTITVPAGSLTFNMQAGGANPDSQTVQVAGIPMGAAVSAMATTDGSNFLTASTSGSTVTVTADGSLLSEGTYQGIVIIFSPGASNSPFYVPVTLTVGPPAVFTATPASVSFAYQEGGTFPAAQTIQLASSSADMIPFSAIAVAPPGSTSGIIFVSITPTSGSTPGTLSVSVDPSVVSNLAVGTYTDFINLTSTSAPDTAQPIQVTLTITKGLPVVPTIVSGASFKSGAVSPGEVVTIFGSKIGPAVPAALTLSASNMVETTLNDTTVTFNGIAAPLIFVSLNQINAIVPYEIAMQQNIPVAITTGGIKSASFNVNVIDTNPALFALNQTGSGPGAILNHNGSLNDAGNPEAPGSTIVIYATGEGLTSPASTTGSVTPSIGTSFPMPSGAVTVTIGGIQAQILYSGEAPGLIAGVLQVNAVVPNGTPSGNQPVVLTVGGVSSPSSVTVAIQ